MVCDAEFASVTGLPPAAILPQLTRLAGRGLLEPTPGANAGWRATVLGRRFLNDLIGSFLPDTNSQARAGS